jgi:hypothetical protein
MQRGLIICLLDLDGSSPFAVSAKVLNLAKDTHAHLSEKW